MMIINNNENNCEEGIQMKTGWARVRAQQQDQTKVNDETKNYFQQCHSHTGNVLELFCWFSLLIRETELYV